MKQKPEVAVVMGSDSDWPSMEKAVSTLKEFGVGVDVRVISAHRTPDEAAKFSSTALKRGIKVIIAAAGGAAHLGGVLAAHTTVPVLGVPMPGGSLNGMDALLATVQMPSGIPVGTLAVGSAGPINAAILAVQILALSKPSLAAKMRSHKRKMMKKVEKGNKRVAEAVKNL